MDTNALTTLTSHPGWTGDEHGNGILTIPTPVLAVTPLLEIEDVSFRTLLGSMSRGAKMNKHCVHVMQASSNPEVHNLLNIFNSMVEDYNRVRYVAQN